MSFGNLRHRVQIVQPEMTTDAAGFAAAVQFIPRTGVILIRRGGFAAWMWRAMKTR